ncbi:MAG: 2-octaprenyl-6-methoxyphenyl hydroxylase [Pseudomonadota bacterium]|nr:2-octaprenyl-6-methoxyphenyl hydroxylase [Pseudomonadota bacterium]
MTRTAWRIAVIGAGPVGLATALHAASLLPHAQITLYDTRPADRDLSADGRTLALSLGSLHFLQRLQAWPADAAEAITAVHVSQVPPSPAFGALKAELLLRADQLGVPQLGATLSYGALVPCLQAAWAQQVAQAPQRLKSCFGRAVNAIRSMADGVELDTVGADAAEHFDLAVVAEGGVFTEQARKPLVRDYGQTAWVGRVTLEGATRGMAFERFTQHGPAALLPLQQRADGAMQAALVWCVPSADDPVRALNDAQRLAVLNTVFPPAAGRLIGIGPLKAFNLGLNAERTLVGGQGRGPTRVRGRTVRIGNAAQTLHPVAGQGLNLGLRDAHALVAALRWADDLDAALRKVEWARAVDRWSMIAATDFLARSFTWQLPGAATTRSLGLAALQAMPPLKGLLARRMMFGRR